jgi:hypothetical protein
LEFLENRGEDCLELYVSICRCFLLNHREAFELTKLETNREIWDIIQFLEDNRFILSTECSQESIKVKPSGFLKSQTVEHYYFLPGACHHE